MSVTYQRQLRRSRVREERTLVSEVAEDLTVLKKGKRQADRWK